MQWKTFMFVEIGLLDKGSSARFYKYNSLSQKETQYLRQYQGIDIQLCAGLVPTSRYGHLNCYSTQWILIKIRTIESIYYLGNPETQSYVLYLADRWMILLVVSNLSPTNSKYERNLANRNLYSNIIGLNRFLVQFSFEYTGSNKVQCKISMDLNSYREICQQKTKNEESLH